jgi:hypothetical protein
MKVEARVREYSSNVAGERIGMSIDESSLSHIMSVLTDLYSDPEMAVIREYSTNALDAHVDAGETRPIEVTLPTPLSPFFKVRDYGAGLSAEDIRDTFSRYGTSTKRESNDVVGMLGLGCKSALTYADQFTLTATKDGRTVQVLVSRDEDGAGSMTVVSDSPAGDAPSGVEIIVPAKRHNAFESKAHSFFRFWDAETVLVNGTHPERIDGFWITDTLLLTQECDRDMVVMGNVAYPSLSDVALSPTTRWHAVAFVEIGAVAFTPSRESLQATKKTREALAAIRDEIARERDRALREQISDAKNADEAVALRVKASSIGFQGDAMYQGRIVPQKLDRTPRDQSGNFLRTQDAGVSDTFLRGGGTYEKAKGVRDFSIPILDNTPRVLFEGFESREMSPTKRDKLAEWFRRRGENPAPYVLVDKLRPAERFWLEGRDVHQWSDVDAIKLERAERVDAYGKPRGSYDCIEPGGRWGTINAEEICTSRPVYWMHGNVSELRGSSARKVLSPDGTFVALPGNRIEKFQRDFPEAIEITTAAKQTAERWLKGQSKKDIDAYVARRDSEYAVIAKLDPAKIEDPALRDAIRVARRDIGAFVQQLQEFFAWIPSLDERSLGGPLKHYPLLVDRYLNLQAHEAHVYLYINAAFAARKEVTK